MPETSGVSSPGDSPAREQASGPGDLVRSLRESPATLPMLAAMALFVVWATDEAGYPLTHWAPGALIVLALLGIALAFVGRPAEVPAPVKIALGCLAAYTALSYASILWASVPAEAWEGANRTLLYLLVFALFACWPQHGRSAALLLGAWTLAMIVLAGVVLLHVNAAAGSTTRLERLLPGGRLTYPTDYANANAALWLIAFWPALLMAREVLHWIVRGLLAGGAVLLAEVALLSVSRGSLYATAVMLVLVFALVPGRVRTFVLLVPVAAGIAAAVPSVVRAGERLEHGQAAASAVHGATTATLLAAIAVTVVVAVGAALEGRLSVSVSPAAARRVHRGLAVAGLATLVVVLAGGVIATGNPATRVRHAWDTFKSPSGYAANATGENRLISGLGSNRYDFYRVALDEFAAHPIVGIGADNFQQQYLVHGRSDETPRYPHSVELRTLAETGLIGALLAAVGLGAALLAGWRALRQAGPGPGPSPGQGAGPGPGSNPGQGPGPGPGSDPDRVRGYPDPLAHGVAAAALAGFAYWAVHGSFDWFWEYAGLGAPAFALLGIACALAPRGRARRSAQTGGIARRAAQPGTPAGSTSVASAASASASEAVASAASASVSTEAASATSVSIEAGSMGASPRGSHVRRIGLFSTAIVALVAAASLIAPWLSQLQIQSAVSVWTKAPRTAYARLEDAAKVNPLSDEPYVVAGNIALRYGDLAKAGHEFALALQRDPEDAYATLERGAIDSAGGDRAGALELLERAARLNPRDQVTREVLEVVRRGERVDVRELNRSILSRAQRLA